MEKIKNLDGIKKFPARNVKTLKGVGKHHVIMVDSVFVRPKKSYLPTQTKFFKPVYIAPVTSNFSGNSRVGFLKSFNVKKQLPVILTMLALVLAFAGGMWAALSTDKSLATDSPQPVVNNSNPVPLGSAAALAQNNDPVSTDILFNTPIEDLQNYFESISEPDVINLRKTKLQQFLEDMKSPLAPAAETIASQDHWKLILAISFAESTLGKNCADNNCSNIGVKPGSPFWRRYSSYQDWVVDFNRLLSKKYNDWTLEQMCGVYVKPCNANWLLATSQILTELKDNGIE